MADVAAACGMPYQGWRRRFTQAVGMPPARYRLLARVYAAQSMLRLTTLSVKDVAVAVGFTDVQHLNRHFRAHLGMTARQYRETS